MIISMNDGRDTSFIKPGATVYCIRPACEDMPVLKAEVECVHAADDVELSVEHLGDCTAEMDDIFATEEEAKAAFAERYPD